MEPSARQNGKKEKGGRMSKTIFYILGIIVLICFFPLFRTYDFYDYHVWECEEAHKAGADWALCSGFWYEPSNQTPIVNDCLIQLSENCKQEVPHTNHFVFIPDKYEAPNIEMTTPIFVLIETITKKEAKE